MRRHLLRALLLLLLAAPARAEGPNIRLVLPFPAGGATDSVARLFAPALAERLGQPVVIENRPGGGGVPAADLVAKAAPDGLTLLLATSSIHSTGPAINPKLPYDVDRDFTPLSLVGVSPSLVLVSATVPAKTLGEFVAWARARPGAVNYGSSGIGTTPHLTGALFDALAKTGMVHVPYRGTGAVYAELLRGEVHALFDVPSTAGPFLANGTVRALAQTAEGETPLAPGLPPATKLLPGMVSETWFGLYGPPRLPAAIEARLQAAAMAALREPALRERLLNIGVDPRGGDGAALAVAAAMERARWVKLVKELDIRPND